MNKDELKDCGNWIYEYEVVFQRAFSSESDYVAEVKDEEGFTYGDPRDDEGAVEQLIKEIQSAFDQGLIEGFFEVKSRKRVS